MNLIDHHTHHRKKPQKSVAIHTYFILFNTDISITFYKSDVHNYVDKELVISDKLYQFYEIKSLKENNTQKCVGKSQNL